MIMKVGGKGEGGYVWHGSLMFRVYTVEGKVSDHNASLMSIITPTSPISSL